MDGTRPRWSIYSGAAAAGSDESVESAEEPAWEAIRAAMSSLSPACAERMSPRDRDGCFAWGTLANGQTAVCSIAPLDDETLIDVMLDIGLAMRAQGQPADMLDASVTADGYVVVLLRSWSRRVPDHLPDLASVIERLKAMHDRGAVHGGISPRWLSEDPPYIFGWGLARVLADWRTRHQRQASGMIADPRFGTRDEHLGAPPSAEGDVLALARIYGEGRGYSLPNGTRRRRLDAANGLHMALQVQAELADEALQLLSEGERRLVRTYLSELRAGSTGPERAEQVEPVAQAFVAAVVQELATAGKASAAAPAYRDAAVSLARLVAAEVVKLRPDEPHRADGGIDAATSEIAAESSEQQKAMPTRRSPMRERFNKLPRWQRRLFAIVPMVLIAALVAVAAKRAFWPVEAGAGDGEDSVVEEPAPNPQEAPPATSRVEAPPEPDPEPYKWDPNLPPTTGWKCPDSGTASATGLTKFNTSDFSFNTDEASNLVQMAKLSSACNLYVRLSNLKTNAEVDAGRAKVLTALAAGGIAPLCSAVSEANTECYRVVVLDALLDTDPKKARQADYWLLPRPPG